MKAIFAGTFDPFTIGHRLIAERAVRLFGAVTVAVANDTGKHAAPLDMRVKIASLAVADVKGVTVDQFSGLLTDYAKAKGECVLIRGVRSAHDFEYERDITRVYDSLSGVQSLLLIADAAYEHVSSTVVRTLAELGADLNGYIVPETSELIAQAYGKQAK